VRVLERARGVHVYLCCAGGRSLRVRASGAARAGGAHAALTRSGARPSLAQVGMAPTDEEIQQVLEQLGLVADFGSDYSFDDFARAADMLSPVE